MPFKQSVQGTREGHWDMESGQWGREAGRCCVLGREGGEVGADGVGRERGRNRMNHPGTKKGPDLAGTGAERLDRLL